MPAHSVVSSQQMEIMVSFMEENLDLANNRLSSGGSMARQRRDKWEELAKRMNSVGVGVTKKTAVKWRDYWSEKKYMVRKKAERGTIGGFLKGMLSPYEKRILNIISNVTKCQPREESSEPSDAPTLPPPESRPRIIVIPSARCVSSPQPTRLPSPPLSSSSLNIEETSAPKWALDMEERRLALEERQANSLERQAESLTVIASALTNIQTMLAHLIEKNDGEG